MVDYLKPPLDGSAILFLGSEEDLKSIPQLPGYNIHFQSYAKDLGKLRIIGIVSENPTVIEDWIRRVRGNSELALLPLVVFSSVKIPFQAIVDGIYPPVFAKDILLGILKEWEPLRNKIDAFSPLSVHLSKRENSHLTLLRYLFLRGLEKLEPVRDIHSRIGYSYPIAEMILPVTDFNECEADLRVLEDRGFLQGKFVDTIHLCDNCGFFQLNFREVCPRCRSANLAEERNIHHFRCGYIGHETDFLNMRCPKCRRWLKHIGVDYDLPAVSFRCLCCEDSFGEPLVACLCLNCGEDFPVEKALKTVVRDYIFTPDGKRYAWDGYRETSIKSESGLLEFGVFKELFSVQKSIAQRAGKKLSLILVRGESKEHKDINTSSLVSQLVTVVKKTLRNQDIMTVPPAGGILALAPDTSHDKASYIAGRIRSACAGNFGDSYLPAVSFYEFDGSPLEEAIEKLYTLIEEAGGLQKIKKK